MPIRACAALWALALLRPANALALPKAPRPRAMRVGMAQSATDAKVGAFFSAAASAGVVGVKATEGEQAAVEAAAAALKGGGAPSPARVPLSGTYELVYSAAKGGSSGKLGPFVGKVTQQIVDESAFINQVQFLRGALRVRLRATREVIDDRRIRVKFVETAFELFGRVVVCKPTTGQGVWENWFVEASADGDAATLRVMKTPSLFVLRRL